MSAVTPTLPPAAKTQLGERVPVLDGLRGIAIVLVLLVHFTPDVLMPNRPLEWMKKTAETGWTGVVLFFVLSGFLITGILLRTKEAPNYFRSFYGRRALRILPLYLGTLVLVFLVAPLIWPEMRADAQFVQVQGHQGWLWAHCANLLVWLHGFPALKCPFFYLGHFWSLAVEEHFYLVWPAIVWWAAEKKLPWICGGIIVAAFGCRIYGLTAGVTSPDHDPFYLTNYWMDALAMGGLLALVWRAGETARLARPAAWIAAITGLLLLACFYLQKGLWIAAPIIRGPGFTVIALFYAAMMVLVMTAPEKSALRRAVDNPFLRFFGKYSYGLYVIHFLVAPHLERWFPKEALMARWHSAVATTIFCIVVKTAICVGLALLSWTLLEAPFLRLKRYFPAHSALGSRRE